MREAMQQGRARSMSVDSSGRPVFSSRQPPPQAVRGQAPQPPSPPSPPVIQSQAYYGYGIDGGPYDSRHPPYAQTPFRPTEDRRNTGGEQSNMTEDGRGIGVHSTEYQYERGYSYEGCRDVSSDHDHSSRSSRPPNGPPGPYPALPAVQSSSSSSPSRIDSYEYRHDYPHHSEGGTGLNNGRSHSSGSTGSGSSHSPPTRWNTQDIYHHRPSPQRHGYSEHHYAPLGGHRPPHGHDHHGRPPPHGYRHYDVDRNWSHEGPHMAPPTSAIPDKQNQYEDERGMCNPYSTVPPHVPSVAYGSGASHAPYQHKSHSPPSHLEFSRPPYRYDHGPSRQSSDGSYDVILRNSAAEPNPSHPHPRSNAGNGVSASSDRRPGATSPSQIESTRRDDVTNMGCTCKRSKCLKLYCMCFGASVMCGPNCRCLICHNTPNHEQARKDAIRTILVRNPSAFDTKFKKSNEKATIKAGTIRPLAHKVGCKCRKSACTKKYCECYNAGVKCSVSCRCVGCQNMPPGGFGPDPRQVGPVASRSFAADVLNMRNGYDDKSHVSKELVKSGEPWMMDAAQNLTFLKHASPQRPLGGSLTNPDLQERSSSIPSLVSSDATPTSDNESIKNQADDTDAPTVSNSVATPEVIADTSQQIDKPAGNVVNALLMAAYAMTELQNEDSIASTLSTAGLPSTNEADPLPSQAQLHSKNLSRSPKRKSNDKLKSLVALSRKEEDLSEPGVQIEPSRTPGCASESISEVWGGQAQRANNGAPLTTPSDQRKIKRSRIGSIKKVNHEGQSSDKEVLNTIDQTPRPENYTIESEDEDDDDDECSASSNVADEADAKWSVTPKGKSTGGGANALTPVTARCIDFHHMDMNGANAEIVDFDAKSREPIENNRTRPMELDTT